MEGFGLSLAICILQNWGPNLTAQQMLFNRSTHLQLKCINGIANFTIAMLVTSILLSVREQLPTVPSMRMKNISFPCSSFHLVDLISLATAIVKWGAETSSFTCSEYIPLYRYTISHIQLHFMVKELCGCWIASPSLYSSIGRVCSLYSSIGRVCPVCERSVV